MLGGNAGQRSTGASRRIWRRGFAIARLIGALFTTITLSTSRGLAQSPGGATAATAPPPAAAPYPSAGYGTTSGGAYGSQATYGSAYAPMPPPVSGVTRKASDGELGVLYGTSAVYGFGSGIWLSTEFGITDPGTYLIAPLVLGVAGPVAVYVTNRPRMHHGTPAAIAAGLVVGAGEGLGVATFQMVSADEADEWGFLGLSRATFIGATAGGAGGVVVGTLLEPPPESSAMTTSGAVWGAAVGSMVGFGASGSDGRRGASLGGLIGYNAGLVAMAGLSTVAVPSWYQLSWMWAGAGIGAAASLPIFLFYMGEDTPPARRGFVFMGTTTTVGLVAGTVLSGALDDVAARSSPNVGLVEPEPPWLTVDVLAPLLLEQGGGAIIGGRWR